VKYWQSWNVSWILVKVTWVLKIENRLRCLQII